MLNVLNFAIPTDLTGFTHLYGPRLLLVVIGTFIGGTIFGCYLWISINLLHHHDDFAFSSLRWPHDKHFLRCHIDQTGLEVEVIKFATVSEANLLDGSLTEETFEIFRVKGP